MLVHSLVIVSDQHEKSLRKILKGFSNERKKKRHSESTIAVTLEEHLLKLLAPYKSYAVHQKSKRCECGYKSCKSIPDPKFGNTGIGMIHFFFINLLFQVVFNDQSPVCVDSVVRSVSMIFVIFDRTKLNQTRINKNLKYRMLNKEFTYIIQLS